MELGFKFYQAPYGHMRFYYMTINGIRFGPVHFSEKSVLESIDKIKRGETI